MPFTLAHPAAVLPLHRIGRGRLPLSALVMGSVAPDFVYYAPFGVDGRYSHGAAGLLLFCVPAGLLAWLLFQIVLRPPLAAMLPDRLFRRLPPTVVERGGWRSERPMPVLAALFLGAITHVVWDAFTHRHTVVRYDMTLLLATVWEGNGCDLPLYKLLQHASSAAGMAALWWTVRRWARRTHPLRPTGKALPLRVRMTVTGAVLATALLRSCDDGMTVMTAGPEHLLVRAAVRGVSSAVWTLLVFCLVWHAVTGIRRLRGQSLRRAQ